MYTFGPIAAAVALAYAVVTSITALLTPAAGPAAAALAVVGLTVAVRLVLLPLSWARVKGEKARARLAPRLDALRREHGADPQRLAAEQQKLYLSEGTSPLAGCLPMLAQTPVFVAVYGVFISTTVAGEPNTLLAHTLAGVPLGSSLGDVLGAGAGPEALVFVLLMAVLAGVAALSRRVLTLPAMARARAAGGPEVPGSRVIGYLPFLTVAVAAFVPLAAGLYLAASTAWTLAENTALRSLVPG
ncbi:YidC/Oxa1 family membrane protein insertase [Murinocardiopsis flavida]|uniref:Membrane protein insertase YidC n=1 Tax=Murinocardiopsis flavida TaxID=645275 RepID=A0A2P8DQN4_9ACTN|nr:membrane protein insertase YidC [Murinocardiopsis flavida]PSK99537.1 YidC/Oxa1 family membrane protein insertase [Murinocardiopsis flavida]